MRTLLIILSIIISSYTNAQYSSALWCFGDSAGINFNNNTTFTTNVNLAAVARV